MNEAEAIAQAVDELKTGITERLAVSHPHVNLTWHDGVVNDRTVVGSLEIDGFVGGVVIEFENYDKIMVPGGGYAQVNVADLLKPDMHIGVFHRAIDKIELERLVSHQ